MNWDIQTFWFFGLGILLAGYAVLDGFDFGVGTLHLFIRGDHDRRLVLNSIGPLWDGNEVWLVTFGGALFAAYPEAYATALSGFYLPFILIMVSLIGRAVSIEFRSKHSHPLWRRYWDVSFAASSTLAAFLFGLAVGNALSGMPIDGSREFVGNLGDLLTPYPILVGVFSVATCSMHGGLYLMLKTSGDLQARVRRLVIVSTCAFLVLYVAVSAATLVVVPHATNNFQRLPVAWVVVALNVLAVLNLPRAIAQRRPTYAFVSSACTILALTFLFGMALFPNLLVSTLDTQHNLTIYTAASSEATLRMMRNIAFLGMPFIASYTGIVYWVFRGKTRLDKFSY